MIDIKEFDRIDESPENNGKKFYGKDYDSEGITEWYDEDGNLDCITCIPEEDTEYQYKLEH